MATTSKKKQIKKKFFSVSIPVINKEIELYGTSIADLDGRFVKYDLTNMLKGKALDLKLKVIANDKGATTEPIEIKLLGSYLRRAARKGTDYSEDSFIAQCEDHRIRIKPFMVTRKRVPNATLKGLREIARKELEEYVKDKSFEKLVSEIINGSIQKSINTKLKKVYPLSTFEIKSLEISDLKEHERIEAEEEEQKEREGEVEKVEEVKETEKAEEPQIEEPKKEEEEK